MIRFQKILCPVDFFPASQQAFDYAVRMAAGYEASVHALHVVAPVIPAAYGGPISLGTLTAELIAQSEDLLSRLKAKADKARVPVQTQVLQGDVDDQILKAVRSTRADLVIMGTHGRRGFERWIMGSVTEKMMRTCPVPLLLTGPSPKGRVPPSKIRNILLTTDFSKGTENAVRYAFSIAQENQASVTFLHVVHERSAPLGGKLTQQLINDIRQKLDELVPAEARVWCDVATRVETGEPYQTIGRILDKEKVSLLVMNIHGKSLLDRALVGSTAERVVRSAGSRCPVLLIPPARARKATRRRIPRTRQKAAAKRRRAG
jgi:nucleotide-binding universal stress UspA family protein